MAKEKEKRAHERLHDLLSRHGAWRKKITLKLRGDSLYWFALLIEKGIEERRKLFLEEDKGSLSAESAASLGSWILELDELVSQIKDRLDPPVKRPKNAI